MTLRLKLACALVAAALAPMTVAVGVAMLRAGGLAAEEADGRLSAVRRQALLIGARWEKKLDSSLDSAADDLSHDPENLGALAQGGSALGAVEAPAGAAEAATALARRHGFDFLELLGSEDHVLSAFRNARLATGRPLSLLSKATPALVAVTLGPLATEPAFALAKRRPLAIANQEAALVGGVLLGQDFVDEIHVFTGEPLKLLDGSGHALASAGNPGSEGRLTGEVPLWDGAARLSISVPAGDARRARRDLLATLAGVAPLALASAVVLGLMMAEGISRPIRLLAARVDDLASRHPGPLSLPETQDEVKRLKQSFERMLDSLEESERGRSAAERIAAWQEIARRIAHEVKNPLSPIKLAVENLRRTREKAPHDFDRAFEEESRTILEEVETLRRLVDEFSQFARLPRPNPIPSDLKELTEQALGLFSPAIDAAGVRVRLSCEPGLGSVRADPEQIGRVLRNVFANAIEALETVGEKTIDIALRRTEGPRGAMAEIEVRDSGVGLEPEALKRIFEPYFTTRSSRGGTGLGMAIAYRIVTDHGGTISVSGSAGCGATVLIRLPFETAGPLSS